MRRHGLSDGQWERIKDHLPGRVGHVDGTAADNRLFVEAVPYRYRAGSPWRDLPVQFGDWKNVHRRLRCWCENGVIKPIFCHLAGTEADLHKIRYGEGSRKVLASDVAVMENDSAARGRVDETVLLRKAASWRYEREWHLVGRRGAQDSPLELEEVVFGIRCKSTVKFTIVQALANRGRPVRFFEIREVSSTFHLRKYALDF